MDNKKLPFMQMWIGDYIKDTRKLTLEEKGAWTEVLWAMHTDNQKGIVQGSWEDISLAIGANGSERCEQLFKRISEKGVCDLEVITQCDSIGCQVVRITNRRMAKEYQIKQARAESGSKGGEATAKNKAAAIELMEQKREEFVLETHKYKDLFSSDIIAIFLNYWLEPNKSRTKYRFEKETYFDFKKRLNTFKLNSYGKTGKGNNGTADKEGYDITPATPI